MKPLIKKNKKEKKQNRTKRKKDKEAATQSLKFAFQVKQIKGERCLSFHCDLASVKSRALSIHSIQLYLFPECGKLVYRLWNELILYLFGRNYLCFFFLFDDVELQKNENNWGV